MIRCRLLLVVLLIVGGFSGRLLSQPVPPSYSGAADPVFDTASLSTDDKSPVIIADIIITGNKKTRPYIIEREIPFKIGNHMMRGELPAKIELARQQLMNTRLFIEVIVKLEKQEDDLAYISVQVKERWYFFPLPYFKIVSRNFNEWWVEHKRSLKRVNYGLKVSHYNISGRNDQMQVQLITGYSQQALFRYQQPAADRSLKFGFDVGFAYSRNKELNYNTDSNKQKFYKNEDRFISESFQGNIALIYRPKVRTRHFLGFSYTRLKIDTSVLLLNPDFFPNKSTKLSYPTISYAIHHYNVDYIPYPTKGITVEASINQRGFSREMSVTEVNTMATYTIPVFPKSQIYLQAAGAVRFPLDQTYYNKRLFGHGPLYMRGLEYYVIDGVAGFLARATARREVLSFNIKPPIKVKGHEKIPFRIFLKV
jgi:outer membrane protein assembly factor BamA